MAGARGSTLDRTASVCADGGPDAGPELIGAASAGGELAVGAGLRSGGGGGDDRSIPGMIPRDEGGGGIRELSERPTPAGRGTTLTGRGTTLTGAGGATDGAEPGGAAGGGTTAASGGRSQASGSSGALAVLESFSSPISLAARGASSGRAT